MWSDRPEAPQEVSAAFLAHVFAVLRVVPSGLRAQSMRGPFQCCYTAAFLASRNADVCANQV